MRLKTAICVGGPTSGSSWSDRQEPDLVAALRGDAPRPGGELRAGPLEAVIAVPHRAERQGLEPDVVLAVRRRDHDMPGPRVGEDSPLERGQPGLVDVLDDLHQHKRVQVREALVPVGQGRLDQPEPLTAARRHPVQPEPSLGDLERARGHVGGDDLGERVVAEQGGGEGTLAAADVGDPARAGRPQHGEHGAAALLGQRHRCIGRSLLIGRGRPSGRDGYDQAGLAVRLLIGVGHGVVERLRLGIVDLGQPGQRGRVQAGPVRQVPARDQRLLRVPGEPARTGPDQLVDLVGADPVVLAVVEHGQQDVQVVERVGQPERPDSRRSR